MNGSINGSAPSDGPTGSGYGDPKRPSSHDDRSSYRGGGGSSRAYGDRGGESRSGGITGSNREPVRSREGGGYGDRDRDRERGYSSRGREEEHGSRKRYHDGDGYDDPRKQRRY